SGESDSPGISGIRDRAHVVPGPGSPKEPPTSRHSIAERYPPVWKPFQSGNGRVAAGSSGGGGPWTTGSRWPGASLIRQAAARATGRPPWVISASSSVIRLPRSEEHTSELQSRENLVCRLLLEK